MKCPIHNIAYKEDIKTGEMTYCPECQIDIQVKWAKENPRQAKEDFEANLRMALNKRDYKGHAFWSKCLEKLKNADHDCGGEQGCICQEDE